MPPKCPRRSLLLVVVTLAVLGAAGCADDDGDDDATPTTRPAGGCPLDPSTVVEAVGHAVRVERAPGDAFACSFLGTADAAGARVEIVVRDLAEEGFGSVLADVERRAGPTVLLPDGLVEGAERGWIAHVGRAVQLGAADEERLVVVALTDPLLDAEAAEEVAAALAGKVLG